MGERVEILIKSNEIVIPSLYKTEYIHITLATCLMLDLQNKYNIGSFAYYICVMNTSRVNFSFNSPRSLDELEKKELSIHYNTVI